MLVAESPGGTWIRPKDWLAVLTNGREGVQAVIEVVQVYEKNVEGFMLFPDDGVPVQASVDQCMKFIKPDAEEVS